MMKDMNRKFWLGGAAALVLGGGMVPSVEAQDALRNRNRFSLNSRFTFLVGADFNSSTPVNDIGPAGAVATTAADAGTILRQYDDGFIGVDVSGNAGNTTWFWGYDNASQATGVGTAAPALTFNSAPSPADQFERESDDEVLPGFELGYAREMWEFRAFNGRQVRGGIGFSFGFTDLSLADRGSSTALVPLTTDTFGIGAAIIPPAPPYRGTVAGPGPVIPDSPTVARGAPVATSATATVINKVEGQIYAGTFGPYLEIPLADRIIAEVSGGVALGYADRTYSFSENVTYAGGAAPAVSRSGSVASGDVLAGASIKGSIGWLVRDNIGLNLGVQYQYLGTTAQTVRGKTARLNLRSAVSVLFGLNWRF